MIINTDIEAFEKSYNDARGYHYRAEQFLKEGRRPSLIINVASVALERYLISLCALHGSMPMNHNYTSLMDNVEHVVDFSIELSQQIRSLDVKFDLCSLEVPDQSTPSLSDALHILTICDNVQKLLQQARALITSSVKHKITYQRNG